MPGRIMSAQQAKKEYGSNFKSIKKSGNRVILKNSSGKKVSVSKNTEVYHRGHGEFGLYGHSRDAHRYKKGARDRVGKGGYRHTEK